MPTTTTTTTTAGPCPNNGSEQQKPAVRVLAPTIPEQRPALDAVAALETVLLDATNQQRIWMEADDEQHKEICCQPIDGSRIEIFCTGDAEHTYMFDWICDQVAKQLPPIKVARKQKRRPKLQPMSLGDVKKLIFNIAQSQATKAVGQDMMNQWIEIIDGERAFHEASANGQLSKVQQLRMAGANLETLNDHGATPIIVASQYANLKTLNDHGATPIIVASQNGHKDMVQYLKDYAVEDNGKTALIATSQNGHKAVVKYLIKHGANVQSIDKHGRTALYVATQRDHLDIVMYLLRKKASGRATVMYTTL